MIPDAEILRIVCEALTNLEVGEFTVKLNHRKILDGIFEVCGVPEANIRPISSAVDKLDKVNQSPAFIYLFIYLFCSFLGKMSRRKW
jgi:histidyl-tRNA synthetase